MDSNDASMFNLATVFPTWQGQMAAFIEAPVRRGVGVLTQQLAGAECVMVEYRVRFDYDGLSKLISRIDPFLSPQAALDELPSIARPTLEAALARHETWSLEEPPAFLADQLPHTGRRTGEKFPQQVWAAKLGDPKLYESMYLRYYVLERSNGELVDQLAGYSGLQIRLSIIYGPRGATPRFTIYS